MTTALSASCTPPKISGATQVDTWATRHHNFAPNAFAAEPELEAVTQALAPNVRTADVLVCHNVAYGDDKVLAPLCVACMADGAILLDLPNICTCKRLWASELLGGNGLSLGELCKRCGVQMINTTRQIALHSSCRRHCGRFDTS